MKKSIFSLFGVAILIAVYGVSIGVSAQTVNGSIANGTVTRGKAARATVVLNIPGGLHANSNRPGSEYAIPTTVTARGSGINVGAITYPRGRTRKFGFSDSSINVYEGNPAFGFNVTVPASYKANTIKVNVTVRYQTCTDEVCYPPKSKQLTLTARVI